MDTHKHPNYIAVWAILVVLTIVSIAIGKFVEPKNLAIGLLFISASIKATMVALFFMHLKFEKGIIIGLVLVSLSMFLLVVFGSMPDTLATEKHSIHDTPNQKQTPENHH